jgi:Flp pilus assembly protein TadB
MKGFRRGKEPAHLKKQRAKAQLPRDATWAQKQAVEAVAGRTPQEVQAMLRRWTWGATAVAVLLVVAGAALYAWSVAAGVVVHVLAAGLLFLVLRMRKQAAGLVEMAKSLR